MESKALQRLSVADIRTDTDTHVRCTINARAVEQYAADLAAGERLPPVVVFRNREALYLAHGFHRLAGRDYIPAYVFPGTREDAAWYALGAHRPTGLRLTSADQQHAIRMALEMRPDLSNRASAEHVGVSDKTVARQCGKDSPGAEVPHLLPRTGIDGRQYPVKPPPNRQRTPSRRPLSGAGWLLGGGIHGFRPGWDRTRGSWPLSLRDNTAKRESRVAARGLHCEA